MKYLYSILEHKFWGKSISQFLNWIDSKSNKYWILIDTETTGLPSDPYDIQLTQISCIVTKYDFNSNTFKEIDVYNKKIKLNDLTLNQMRLPGSRIKKVLSFNHYGQKNINFYDEQETLQDFFNFLKRYTNSLLVIQNAQFDMRYFNTRHPSVKFDNEVLDTKRVIQLFYLPLLLKLAETRSEFKEMVNKIGISDRDNGLISSSMSKIGPALGIDMTGYHDALFDCRLMAQMFIKIIDFLKQYSNIDITKYQTQRIKIKKFKESDSWAGSLLAYTNPEVKKPLVNTTHIPIHANLFYCPKCKINFYYIEKIENESICPKCKMKILK